MSCPYCNSSNWDVYGVFKVDYQHDHVTLCCPCLCYDCGERFAMKQEYVETDNCEYLTLEEWRESE